MLGNIYKSVHDDGTVFGLFWVKGVNYAADTCTLEFDDGSLQLDEPCEEVGGKSGQHRDVLIGNIKERDLWLKLVENERKNR